MDDRAKEQIASMARFSRLHLPIFAQLLDASETRAEFFRTLADVTELVTGTCDKDAARMAVFLWAHGVFDDDDALEVLSVVEGGEAWADLAMGWTPEERLAAVEALEDDNWAKEVIQTLS
jgi:hypothetical protein